MISAGRGPVRLSGDKSKFGKGNGLGITSKYSGRHSKNNTLKSAEDEFVNDHERCFLFFKERSLLITT
ncbi:hypothetical protein FC063_19930 [Vibrio tasmaniensis]|uniref:Uncharacterized protein n=1 Tax=Vibrio tasmaniensis TaxID=212663 RepID=A0A2N7NL59_9VIBR|nr:hypothetical protein BCS92_09655 [Vibrio tasmaniensis]TKG31489.1 hypothetical protein FC057_15225 [Vibrio tasmaniensis]TKG38285.1 hypothetical protein FC063_19930 [Vibrio tasmaniensis]TKG44453.1 hypothetical protein FC060_17535 [Vibrio tasmaniensis]TKG50049.1 hypothetical protein FC070_13755 [Vibrio tasmaniensis]